MREETMNPTEPSKANTRAILKLFVYGTLKRGFWNHDRFCAHAQKLEPATVWGKLYHLPAGFPALEVPESTILAQGTSDPLADAETQGRINIQDFDRPPGDWDLVHGELVTFTDPLRDLPPIDRLEGFRPLEHSMYQRVMVAARAETVITSVWLYRMECLLQGERVANGQWERS
jgi:gamma-glutamylcyclotransferase (GGCT)/AIG2-like uncharacterized protein YtfP